MVQDFDGDRETGNSKLETVFVGFALTDCLIHTDAQTEKYLRRVIRTALELAIYNRFGAEIGGFWLMNEQIDQLRKLPEYYAPAEAALVANAVEIYLQAQLRDLYEAPREKLLW
ncbi:MAG TPA: hypothetical protein VJS64_19655 [Pyrinomonadaceae bacterium]|nr:hypothetical protein [Pyrinomonadaceae bacterium]